LTFFINADALYGCDAIGDRPALVGIKKLGMRLYAYPVDGFVRFYPAIATAENDFLEQIIRRHEPTLLDIRLRRIVGRGVFELQTPRDRPQPFDFRDQPPGEPANLED
jgi:hypothetical protein